MITLTIFHGGLLYQQAFNQERISIGSDKSGDIPLSSKDLKFKHIEIEMHAESYSVKNMVHDPNVTLNGLAFGRRSLSNGDVLTFHNNRIVVDRIEFSEETREESADLLDRVDNLSCSKVAPLFKEVPEDKPEPKKRAWPRIAALSSFLLIFLMSGFTFYTLSYHIAEEDKFEAALSTADVGIALFNAQINDKIIPTHKLGSKNILKELLPQVIGHQDSPIYQMTPGGLLPSRNYALKVLTNRDQSRFLVVTAPTSWWSLSEPVFVFDSKELDLNEIPNTKELDRLLSNPYALEDSFTEETDNLIDAGELITLRRYVSKQEHSELISPKGLGFIRLGADNLVYNTPRYYRLTEKMIAAATHDEQLSNEAFQNYLEKLMPLDNLVFYTTYGIESALHAYETLNSLFPQEEYLVGSLSMDPTTDEITSSLLLTLQGAPRPKSEPIAMVETEEDSYVKGDDQSTWFNEMIALRVNRTEALKPIMQSITELLTQHNNQPDPSFNKRIQGLLTSYEKVDQVQQDKVKESLESLYDEYVKEDPSFTTSRFLMNVKMTGLGSYITGGLKNYIDQDETDRISVQHYSDSLDRVRNSESFDSLYRDVDYLIDEIAQSGVSEGVQETIYGMLKEATLQKIENLLDPNAGLKHFHEKDRYTMEYILERPNIASSTEEQYYLDLFEKRCPKASFGD